MTQLSNPTRSPWALAALLGLTAVYPIIIGLYTLTEDGSFARLQRITEDGRPTDDFLQLTLVRVD